jgi:hypothetical protein
LVFS